MSCFLSPSLHRSTGWSHSYTPSSYISGAHHKSHRHQRRAQILRLVRKKQVPIPSIDRHKTTVIPENIQKNPLREQHPSSKKLKHHVDLAETKLTNNKSKVTHFQRTGIILPIPVARIGRTWKGKGRRSVSALDLPARSDLPGSTPDLATLRVCGGHESDAQRTRILISWISINSRLVYELREPFYETPFLLSTV